MMIPPFGALVLDIEGTTTPISFVHDTLFPYAAEHLDDFIRQEQQELGEVFSLLAEQAQKDRAQGLDAPAVQVSDAESVIANVRWQMARDQKSTGLKQLQGKIWKAGYEGGELKGEVYEDTVRLLRACERASIPVCIYSSGSIQAQKLLFGHSTRGDLTAHLSGYYDTTTGPKKQAASYELIARALGLEPKDVLFATDHIDEARAAHQAGVTALLLVRPGNAALPEHDFLVSETFEPLIAHLEA